MGKWTRRVFIGAGGLVGGGLLLGVGTIVLAPNRLRILPTQGDAEPRLTT